MELTILVFAWFFTYDLPRQFFSLGTSAVIYLLIGCGQLLLICGSYFFLKRINQVYKISYYLTLMDNKKLRPLSVSMLGLFILILVMHADAVNHNLFLLSAYTAVMLLVYMTFFTILFYYMIESLKKSEELKLTREMYLVEKNKLELSDEFRHDFKSLIIGLEMCLSSEDYLSASNLLKQMTEQTKPLFTSSNYEKIETIQDIAVQGILLQFDSTCKAHNIHTYFSIVTMPVDLHVQEIDVVRSLSILLNNALEETLHLSVNERKIIVQFERNPASLQIKIINRLAKKVDLGMILKKRYTSKINHKGIGLNSLMKIANNSNFLDFHLSQEEQNFIATLILS